MHKVAYIARIFSKTTNYQWQESNYRTGSNPAIATLLMMVMKKDTLSTLNIQASFAALIK